jgi:hypothetical protein
LSGQQYFLEEGSEVIDGMPGDTSVFEVLWLRKDSAGNVVVGAAGSANIDSATVFSWILFPNEFLTQGYSRTYADCGDQAGLKSCQDSVLSVAETVSVPAGTFENCLKISETHYDSAGIIIWREYHYYAYGIGLVKVERTEPVSEAHTDVLMEYSSGATAAWLGRMK